MRAGLQTVAIFLLRGEGKEWLATQMRVRLDEARVKAMAEADRNFTIFAPPVVFVDHEGVFRVGDGFHRIEAYFCNGKKDIQVDVHPGEFRDAWLWNIEANRTTLGKPFSSGDFIKAIKQLLNDPECSNWTRPEIAAFVGCDRTYVSRIARSIGKARYQNPCRADVKTSKLLELRSEGKTFREIAEIVDMDKEAVRTRVFASREFLTCPTCKGTGKVIREVDHADHL